MEHKQDYQQHLLEPTGRWERRYTTELQEMQRMSRLC